MPSSLLQELLKSPAGVILTLILAITGIIFVFLAILRNIPRIQVTGRGSVSPISLQPSQAIALGLFGLVLLGLAVVLVLYSPNTQSAQLSTITETAPNLSSPTVIFTLTPDQTETYIPSPTVTETETPQPTQTEAPTSTLTPTLAPIPDVPRTFRIEWINPEQLMTLQFYREGFLIKELQRAKSGDNNLDWAPPGILEIKFWAERAAMPEDSIFVNVAPPVDCSEAKFTSPNGIRDVDPNPNNLPKLEKNNTLILWFPLDCKMIVEFYQHGNAINRFQEVLPGEVDLSWMAVLGQTEVKIWLPGSTSFVTDAMQINVVASP